MDKRVVQALLLPQRWPSRRSGGRSVCLNLQGGISMKKTFTKALSFAMALVMHAWSGVKQKKRPESALEKA